MSFPVGAFELQAQVGRGGMGTVWRGSVRGRALPVAIKILDVRRRRPRFLERFKAEVRAMARLDHPGIVDVYDYGLVSAEEARPDLEAGSPYVAMRWIDGDTLAPVVRRPVEWAWIRDALLQILDALAHAHARSVIHCDLKPENVLVDLQRDGAHLTLVDFGIARADAESGGRAAGTPHYMAPEQFAAGELGPWTDLYGLGCVAHRLVCGRLPFDAPDVLRLSLEHAERPPPPLMPTIAVPPELAGWVHWLLAKAPAQRPQRAADAAYALARMGPPTVPAARPRDVPRSELETFGPSDFAVETAFDPALPSGPAPFATATGAPTILGPLLDGAPSASEHDGGIGVRPPVPRHWSKVAPRLTHRWLEGVGLGLVGLREHPMVGREAERSALWKMLRDVDRKGMPHLVRVEGAAGMGKSRLARWLVERADELGAAQGFRLEFEPEGWGSLAPLLRRITRVGDATEEQLRRRLTERTQEPAGPLTATEVDVARAALEGRATEPALLRAIVARLLREEARKRPVVLWLDDLQWGPEGCALLTELLRGDGAILAIATLRRDALRDDTGSMLKSLPADRLALEPLDEGEAMNLMHALLGLDRTLADEVVHRTGGHPLFATQLVEEWSRRGMLEAGAAGYVLAEGSELTIPDGLHHVWRARIDRVLITRPERDRLALELGALVGAEIDVEVWRSACVHRGLALDEGLIDILLGERLLEPSVGGLRFVHGLLRESVVRLAREAGRASAHHRACAAALRGDESRAAARGRHLLAAGAHEAALAPLLRGAADAVERAAIVEAEALLAAHREALVASGATEGRIAALLVGAQAASIRARHEEAEARVGAALADADQALFPQAILRAAEVAERAGRRREAHDRYATAYAAFAERGDEHGSGLAAAGWGTMAAYLGELEVAMARCEEAVRALAAVDEPLALGRAERTLANLCLLDGATDRARALYRAAQARFEGAGAEYDLHKCLNGLAETHRLDGDYETALESYERLLARQQRIVTTSDVDLTRFNIALTLLALARYDEAATRLREVALGLAERPHPILTTGSLFAWLVCHASREDHPALADAIDRAEAEVDRDDGHVEHDDAINARLAGDLAAGWAPDLAARCYRVALVHWARHRAADECAATEERLVALETA